jgi:hypothetical protein
MQEEKHGPEKHLEDKDMLLPKWANWIPATISTALSHKIG